MASCLTVARFVGSRPFIKKDGNPGYNLSVALDSGDSVTFMGNGQCPSFPFGTAVSIGFDLNIFQGKVNGIRLESVEEYGKK